MLKKIIFIIESTFNQRDYKRFGIDILLKSEYDVYVYDLTPFLKPVYYNNYNPPDPIDQKSFTNYTLIIDKCSLEKRICYLTKQDIVIAHLGVNKESLFIFEKLIENNVIFGFLLLGLIPNPKFSLSSLYSRIISIMHHPSRVQSKFVNLVIKTSKKISANFIITGGEKALLDKRYPIDKNTTIIHAHSFDYDKFLELEKGDKSSLIKQDYAIFLDEYVPYHPDYLFSNAEPDCNAKEYYTSLNRFFEHIEKKLQLKVIIAAHPRSHYDNNNPFKDRKIVRENTISLVKNSEFVLAHCSTSLSFAILYRKPVMFITDRLYSVRYQNLISTFASSLGKKPIELSSKFPNKLDKELLIESEYYNSYKEMYIKETGTPEKFIWEIFADYCG